MPRRHSSTGLLLALGLTLLAAALPFAHSGQQSLVGMNEMPSNAKFQDLLRRSDRTRPNQDPDLYALLFRHLESEDVADLKRCRKLVDRKRYDELAADRLHPRRCRNEMWCPTCSRVQWGLRRRYHIEKLRSIAPDKSLTCFHLVFTLPDILTPIVRKSPAAREEFVRSAWDAIHRSWDKDAPVPGERGAYTSRRHFSESHGALVNVHPWGDERKNREDPRKPVWPVWRPHIDMLLAGHRVKDGQLVPLRETWPTLFRKTRAYYREALRERFTPLLGRLPLEGIETARAFLQTTFEPVCWVSPSGLGKHLHRDGQAVKRIEYSSRSLWDPSRIITDFQQGEDIVIYPTQGGRARHRVSARLLFPMLYELKQFTIGKEVHRSWGFLAKSAYGKTARMAGNEPISMSPHTGAKLVATYYPNYDGVYDAEHQVMYPGLGPDRERRSRA